MWNDFICRNQKPFYMQELWIFRLGNIRLRGKISNICLMEMVLTFYLLQKNLDQLMWGEGRVFLTTGDPQIRCSASQRNRCGLDSHMMTLNQVRREGREGTYRDFSTLL